MLFMELIYLYEKKYEIFKKSYMGICLCKLRAKFPGIKYSTAVIELWLFDWNAAISHYERVLFDCKRICINSSDES